MFFGLPVGGDAGYSECFRDSETCFVMAELSTPHEGGRYEKDLQQRPNGLSLNLSPFSWFHFTVGIVVCAMKSVSDSPGLDSIGRVLKPSNCRHGEMRLELFLSSIVLVLHHQSLAMVIVQGTRFVVLAKHLKTVLSVYLTALGD